MERRSIRYDGLPRPSKQTVRQRDGLRRPSFRLRAVVALGLLLTTTSLVAQDDNTDLDKQLQAEFGDDLLEGLDDIPLGPGFGEDNPGNKPADTDLQRDLTEGEDIGQSQENELDRIARQMRQVQERIENKEVSSGTQDLQKEIVAQLDALIKQLEQQKKQSSSSSTPSSSGGQPNINQPDQQPNQGQNNAGNKPATDSEERLGHQDAAAMDQAALEALVKQVWGHLPDRAKQEMQNATVEDFLPKYQQLIEDYYRRLAEETPR